jgi:hypothetical protein
MASFAYRKERYVLNTSPKSLKLYVVSKLQSSVGLVQVLMLLQLGVCSAGEKHW